LNTPQQAERPVTSQTNSNQVTRPIQRLRQKRQSRNLSVIQEEPVKNARRPPPPKTDVIETSTIITESSLGTYKSKNNAKSIEINKEFKLKHI